MAEHRIRDRRPNLVSGLALGVGALAGFPFLGSRAGGTILSRLGTRREQEADDEFVDQQEAIADRLNLGQNEAFDQLEEGVGQISATNLARSEKFFGSQRARFSSIADPAIARADELAGQFGDIETEGRALTASLDVGQQAREDRVLQDQLGRSQDLVRRQGELGEAEVAEIIRQFQAAQGIQRGRLAGRGFGGTSVGASILESGTRAQAGSVALARERLAGQSIGLQERADADRSALLVSQTGQTLAQEAAGGEFNLGLARDRIGAEEGALQFRTDLGFAGLSEEERALQTLQEDRTRFGLAPAEAAIRRSDADIALNTVGIQRERPISGRFRRSASLSTIDRLE